MDSNVIVKQESENADSVVQPKNTNGLNSNKRINPHSVQINLTPGRSGEDLIWVKKEKMQLDLSLTNHEYMDGCTDDDGETTPLIPRKTRVFETNDNAFLNNCLQLENDNSTATNQTEVAKDNDRHKAVSDPEKYAGTLLLKELEEHQIDDRDSREILYANRVRELEKLLEDAQFRFQLQKRRSISAVNILSQSLNFLQNDIGEILSIDDEARDIMLDTNQVCTIRNSIKMTPRQGTYISTGTDSIEFPAQEKEVHHPLKLRFQSLEKAIIQRLKVFEAKRTEMLHQIRRNNEILSKILEQHSGNVTMAVIRRTDPKINARTGENEKVLMFYAGMNLKRNRDCAGGNNETVVNLATADSKTTALQTCLEASVLRRDSSNVEKHLIEFTRMTVGPEQGESEVSQMKSSSQITENPNYSISSAMTTKTSFVIPSIIAHIRDETKPGHACICGENYKSRTGLWKHIRRQNPPSLKCDLCEKQFHTSISLNNHSKKHHNVTVNGRFNCYSCKDTSRSEMSKHSRGLCPLVLTQKENRKIKRTRLSSPISPSP